MSARALAELLDDLIAQGRAGLGESSTQVMVSGLDVVDARAILVACRAIGWSARAADTENTQWTEEQLSEDFAPFRITVDKAPGPLGVERILTNTAFAQWLDEGTPAGRWQVGRLLTSIRTWGAAFSPWQDDALDFAATPATKSPRSLVREYGSSRSVVQDIRPWILRDAGAVGYDEKAFQVWADRSVVALAHSVANEIDSEDGTLRFKGPPRLTLSAITATDCQFSLIGRDGFSGLQALLAWIFETDREAEMRHILAAAEIAQSGGSETEPIACLSKHAYAALDGARVAYQLSLSDVSKDSLKLLSDLRKAVTEEVGKLTDQTRQLVTSIAGALAVGIGLIAARLTTATPSSLLLIVMVIVAAHIALTIWAGARFIKLQGDLRTDWRPRLYRFLPPADYETMVNVPIRAAENAFKKSSIAGGVITVLLAVAVAMALVLGGVPPATESASKGAPAGSAPLSGAAAPSGAKPSGGQ